MLDGYGCETAGGGYRGDLVRYGGIGGDRSSGPGDRTGCAYKQPVTKAEIEKIRGVKCDHTVNKLVEYDLVKEVGRLEAPGRPILFGTTEEFLRSFGVQGLDELPVMDTVQVEDFKAEAEEEVQLKLDV